MWRGMAVGTGLAPLMVSVVSGQWQRSPATLDDLLTELRGLRTDLNASVGINTRAQVIRAQSVLGLTLQQLHNGKLDT